MVPSAPVLRAHYTRVAVVQLAYHPAALIERVSPLEDPLFDFKKRSSLLPASGEFPRAWSAEFKQLKARVRQVHNEHLLAKVIAVLDACRRWDVRIVVFPEYSIAPDLLPEIAKRAGDMVVVAGTHTVERATRKSGLYEQLGWPEDRRPSSGLAVCPVIADGRLIALQPKLNAAKLERGMRLGQDWSPVKFDDLSGIPGPMGIMICLDFLHREGGQHRSLVAEKLEACRFLAVPSLTPAYTLDAFSAQAWEEARRYGRPVLYSDNAFGGGTSIYVDEGREYELRDYPRRVGYLDKDDEGVVIADVNLGYRRVGESTRYDEPDAVVPFACASLVYRNHPVEDEYAERLVVLGTVSDLVVSDLDSVADYVEDCSDVFLRTSGLPGAQARARRLRRLLDELDNITSLADLQRFTREIVLEPGVLPLPLLRQAMARGAAEQMFDWMRKKSGGGLEEVETRLRKASADIEARATEMWTDEAWKSVVRVRSQIFERNESPAPAPTVKLVTREVVPSVFDPVALGERTCGPFRVLFRRTPAEFLVKGKKTLKTYGGSVRSKLGEAVLTDGVVRWARESVQAVEQLWLWLRAQGLTQLAVVGLRHQEGQLPTGALTVLGNWQGKHTLWVYGDGLGVEPDEFAKLLADDCFGKVVVERVSESDIASFAGTFFDNFKPAAEKARIVHKRKLENVAGTFEPISARLATDNHVFPGDVLLEEWVASTDRIALVLGQFGSGKSTLTNTWAWRRWERGQTPAPIVIDLATAGRVGDVEAMLLAAVDLTDSAAHRAGLRLLIRRRLLVPCFDGLDEMATRVEFGDVQASVTSFLRLVDLGGYLLLTSRDHFFARASELTSVLRKACSTTGLGESEVRTIRLQPLTPLQIENIVQRTFAKGADSRQVLHKISTTYDLNDLVTRPMLLGMVLETIEQLDPDARVASADIYEAYLEHWLSHTRSGDPEAFTDDQKQIFAEALAEKLWRTGASSCSWQELRTSVLSLMSGLLVETPSETAFHEIQGGAFFVWEESAENQFRFAHKSFLEFFFARGLLSGLTERPAEVLDTRSLTAEVLDFVHELLRREGGDLRKSPAIRRLHQWLVDERGALADSSKPLAETAEAAANAFRLLMGLAERTGESAGWIPPRADFRMVKLSKVRICHRDMSAVRLDDATLDGAHFVGVNLSRANLRRASLRAIRVEESNLQGLVANGADFTYAGVDDCDLENASLVEACLDQSAWTGCRWSGSDCAGAASMASDLPQSNSQGRVRVKHGHQERVFAVSWAPNGRCVASGGFGGEIRVWDVSTGEEVACLAGHKPSVRTLSWAADSRRVASGGEDGKLRVWDASSGEELICLAGHQGRVTAVSWAPDGQRVASSGDDGMVRVWDASSGEKLTCLTGHQGTVAAVSWAPHGGRVVSSGQDQKVWVWDASSGEELVCFVSPQRTVTAVSWAPEGQRVAGAGLDGKVRVWDASSGEELTSASAPESRLRVVSWEPDGQRIAGGGDDGKVRVWDASTGEEVASFAGHRGTVWAVSWSPDGRCLVSGGDDGKVRIWDSLTGDEVACLVGHQARMWAVSWAPDGRRVVCGGKEGGVRVWDASSGEVVASLAGNQGDVIAVSWAPDGRRVASGGRDGQVRVWDVSSESEVACCSGHQEWVWAVSWAPSGRHLVSCGDDEKVRMWDASSGKALACLEGHQGTVWDVSWAPDGRRVASGGDDGIVRVWDVSSGSAVLCLTKHPKPVMAVSWSSDGRRVASGGNDGTVRVWCPSSGKVVASLEGHRGRVWAVSWASDGRSVVSGGEDGTVRVWDISSGEEVARLAGHQELVPAVSWSPDQGRIVSSSAGKIIVHTVRGQALATLYGLENSFLTITPGGFFCGDSEYPGLAMSVPRPENSESVLYRPLAGYRRLLHRPDRVRAALAGDLSNDDSGPILQSRPWDGRGYVFPGAAKTKARSESVPRRQPKGLVPKTQAPLLLNPFLPGSPMTDVEVLPGREAIVAELQTLIEIGNPALLKGPRRSGKSSILSYLERVSKPHRLVYNKSLESHAPKTPDELAMILDPELVHTTSPAKNLRATWDRVTGERPVVLLDEIGKLYESDDSLFTWLRSIGQEGVVRLVVAGSHADWGAVLRQANRTPGSSFGNDYRTVELGPLPEEQARTFLVETAPPDVSLERAAEWVLEVCGCWPLYIQVMGYTLVQAARRGDLRPLVDRRAFIDLYEDEVVRNERGVFEGRWGEITSAAQRVLLTEFDEAFKAGRRSLSPYHELGRTERIAVSNAGLIDARDGWIFADDRPFFDWLYRSHGELEVRDATDI